MSKNKKNSEYELFKHYSEEYLYLKKRLAGMDFKNNPVKDDSEYIEILNDEIYNLKDENAQLRIELSNQKLFNSLPFYKKMFYIITKKYI